MIDNRLDPEMADYAEWATAEINAEIKRLTVERDEVIAVLRDIISVTTEERQNPAIWFPRLDKARAICGWGTSDTGLTIAEKKAQAMRCSCHGSDDYCPCQNRPDVVTLKARAFK